MIRRLLRVDGPSLDLREPVAEAGLAALLRARLINRIAIAGDPGEPGHLLIVDDDGYQMAVAQQDGSERVLVPALTAKAPNHEATRLANAAGLPGVVYSVRGDALIAPAEDYRR